ncbi:Band 4.1-like protein 4 [Araneus ventricosus]|uniref:Band 4.1-like protein 4 n=1 Tax=Araneus ventricosus TaxID=182803 RepID=A0A4Y2DMK6_ARAVE|nr:Band 4.1-like protein 4 [Araneus ventricosus]
MCVERLNKQDTELGDYDPRRHLPGYAAEFNFVPNQTKDLESKAMEIHKGLCGTVPAVAEINFLDRIKWLDMYGVDLHPVLDTCGWEQGRLLVVLLLDRMTRTGVSDESSQKIRF